jgi:hypothetical protein
MRKGEVEIVISLVRGCGAALPSSPVERGVRPDAYGWSQMRLQYVFTGLCNHMRL